MASVARTRPFPALLLSVFMLLLCAACFAQTNTLAAPTLVSPAYNATGVTIPARLTWSAPGSSSYIYAVQVSRNEGFTDLACSSQALNEAAVSLPNLTAGTRYWWRVQAYNDYGYSSWTNAFIFTTAAATVVNPAVPVLLSPASGATSIPVSTTLSWKATERAATYTVLVAQDQAFAKGVITRALVTATSVGVDGLLTNTGYFWKVKAVNASGESDWSAVWAFTTAAAKPLLPSQPVLLAPVRGAAATLPVKLQWQASERATGYNVQVSAQDSFATLVAAQDYTPITSMTVSTLPNNARYYWRVRAIGGAGASLWSETWTFTLGTPINQRLAAPTLLTPVNGATAVPLTATFTWKPVDGALSYALQLSTGGVVISTRADLTTTSLPVPDLTPNTAYQWVVRAANGDGVSPWSAAWTFTTTTKTVLLPAAPELLTPDDGAMNVPLDAQLCWKAAERATSYLVVITLMDGATQKELRLEGITGTSVKLPSLPFNTKCTWRARGVSASGAGPWSIARTFTTATPPPPALPAVPVLSLPANGATDLAQTVLLTWAPAERATSYAVQVAATDAFDPVVFANTAVTGASVEVRDLKAGARYCWRVKAINVTGASAWSTIWAFSTKGSVTTLQPPAPPTLKFPENGAMNVPVQARLLWTPGERATSHILQYSIDPTFGFFASIDCGASLAGIDVTWNPDRLYYWRVKAVNAAGESAWSDVRHLSTVPSTPVVTAPKPPALLTPADAATNQALVLKLTWAAATSAKYYTVQLSSSNTFAANVYTKQGVTDTAAETPSLLPNTVYYWRVKSIGEGGESLWSVARSFTTCPPTVAMLPGTPSLQSPIANAKDAAAPLRLLWAQTERAYTYTVQVAKTPGFEQPVVTRDGLINTQYDMATLDASTTYYWRVRGVNAYGVGSWSDARAFTSAAPPAPVLPGVATLVTPAAAAKDVSTSARFTWMPADRATSYTVQVSLNDSFTNLIAPAYTSLNTVLETTGLKPSTQLYWRVRGVNASGVGAWSETRGFTTAAAAVPGAPAAPTLLSPANGVAGVMQTTRFYWSKPDGATRYILQVATTDTFAPVFYTTDNLTTIYADVFDLQANTTYYWRVKAVGALGESAWSTVWSCTTLAAFKELPATPAQVSPADGKLTVLRPRLTWSTVIGASGYIVEVAKDAQFTQKLASETMAVTTTYQVAPGLTYGATYYWRVRAYNKNGLSPWSPVSRFTPSMDAK